MTTARIDEGNTSLSRTPTRDKRIAAEVRAEIARQGRPETQAEMALAIFGEKQAWLSRRLRGVVAFTPGELLEFADWLDVDVLKFLVAGKRSPANLQSVTALDTVTGNGQLLLPYLSIVGDEADDSPRVYPHLRLVS